MTMLCDKTRRRTRHIDTLTTRQDTLTYMKNNYDLITKRQNRRKPATYLTDIIYADDISLVSKEV